MMTEEIERADELKVKYELDYSFQSICDKSNFGQESYFLGFKWRLSFQN